jgi:hypothetical protein
MLTMEKRQAVQGENDREKRSQSSPQKKGEEEYAKEEA